MENGNWALVGLVGRQRFGQLELEFMRQLSEPENRREKKGVHFGLASVEIRVIAAGAAKSVFGNEAVFSQRRKARKTSNRGGSGVGAPNKHLQRTAQAGRFLNLVLALSATR